jgi:hypothetical protein
MCVIVLQLVTAQVLDIINITILHTTLVGVSFSLYYKYLSTLHVSAQLATFMYTGNCCCIEFCLRRVGRDWVRLVTKPLFGLSYKPRTMGDDGFGAVGGDDWRENPKCSEKTCPSSSLSTTDPTRPELGSNPGRLGGKPTTNRLRYSTATGSLLGWHCAIVAHVQCLRFRWSNSLSCFGERQSWACSCLLFHSALWSAIVSYPNLFQHLQPNSYAGKVLSTLASNR